MVDNSQKDSTSRHASSVVADDAIDQKLQNRRKTMVVAKSNSLKDISAAPSKSSKEISARCSTARGVSSRQSLPAYTPKSIETNSKPNGKGFSSILQQWQTVSADKPCSHFLSPDQKAKETRKQRPDNRFVNKIAHMGTHIFLDLPGQIVATVIHRQHNTLN